MAGSPSRVVRVALVDGDQLEASQKWTDVDYAKRDAELAKLGIQFKRRRG